MMRCHSSDSALGALIASAPRSPHGVLPSSQVSGGALPPTRPSSTPKPASTSHRNRARGANHAASLVKSLAFSCPFIRTERASDSRRLAENRHEPTQAALVPQRDELLPVAAPVHVFDGRVRSPAHEPEVLKAEPGADPHRGPPTAPGSRGADLSRRSRTPAPCSAGRCRRYWRRAPPQVPRVGHHLPSAEEA